MTLCQVLRPEMEKLSAIMLFYESAVQASRARSCVWYCQPTHTLSRVTAARRRQCGLITMNTVHVGFLLSVSGAAWEFTEWFFLSFWRSSFQ